MSLGSVREKDSGDNCLLVVRVLNYKVSLSTGQTRSIKLGSAKIFKNLSSVKIRLNKSVENE